MTKLNATEYADKWASRLSAAGEDVRRGVDRVTEAPGRKAAMAKERMKAAIIKAIDDGTWSSQVAAVSLEDWKASMMGKGINRLSEGVNAAKGKQVQMAEKLLAAVDASVAEANQTPRGSLEDNINRMTTFVRGMSKRKIRRPGS